MVRGRVSDLAAGLERCAGLCEETLSAYVERLPEARGSRFAVDAVLAAAAMTTAAYRVAEGGRGARLALHVAATLAREAAASARAAAGLDEDVLLLAATCDRVADRCERMLAPVGAR